ncbi:hypothetical protein ACFWDA_21710 [Rhodococcus zopfii]|uniref:hypothetical protein n=1 Tax=Rhodococcus zopfii TaxID=43772 RepID=UPI0009337FC0|nr:hypothetical protein [Rhodococcus zopfii]
MGRWKVCALACAVVLATGVAVGACGAGDSGSGESQQTTVSSTTTQVAELSASGTGEPDTGTQPTFPAESVGGIAVYQPSTEISRALGSAVLTTSDPLEKVSDFYVGSVDREGWQSVSRSITPHSTSLTVRKDGKGASISVSMGGDGTLISISTYPSP